jgi:CBS domain containing-hemolysin-like protein
VPVDRLASIDAEAPFPEMLRIVAANPFSRLPVYESRPDHLIGVLHTKDVVTAFVNGRQLNTRDLMRQIVRVPPEMPADRLLAFLRESRTHQAFVAAPTGEVLGLVTLEDVVAELLGGVADEFKGVRRKLRVTERRR